jgi:hypothetical protein
MGTITEVTEIKPYSTRELARIYGVCDRTFLKWLKPFISLIGAKQGRYYTVAQVEMIFEKLGKPYRLKEE